MEINRGSLDNVKSLFSVKITYCDPVVWHFQMNSVFSKRHLKEISVIKPAHYKLYFVIRNLEVSGDHELAKIWQKY